MNTSYMGVDSDRSATVFLTVFDAIRSARITPYAKLSDVEVTRKRPEGLGGGRIRTKLNFISLLTSGDDTHNIRLFDGDTVFVGKSPSVLKSQLSKAVQTNLNPQFINVYVAGRVNTPGEIKIPQGGTLNLALTLAGGPKQILGK